MHPSLAAILLLLLTFSEAKGQPSWSLSTGSHTTRIGEVDTLVCAIVGNYDFNASSFDVIIKLLNDSEGEFKLLDSTAIAKFDYFPEYRSTFRVVFRPHTARDERLGWIEAKAGNGEIQTNPVHGRDLPPFPGAYIAFLPTSEIIDLSRPPSKGRDSVWTFQIKNQKYASESLRISHLRIGAPFSISFIEADSLIEPGGVADLTVRLDSAVHGIYLDTLRISSNAVNRNAELVVPVQGDILGPAFLQITADTWSFRYPPIILGRDSVSIKLEAIDGLPIWLKLGEVRPPFFYARPQDSAGATFELEEGQSEWVPIVFRPVTLGTFKDSMMIESNAYNRDAPFKVRLEGRATSLAVEHEANISQLKCKFDRDANSLVISGDFSQCEVMRVYNQLGQIVLESSFRDNSEIRISTSALSSGAYYVVIGDLREKFIID